jgi:proline racemase
MAILVAQGKMAIGDKFTNEGLLGTLYYGKARKRGHTFRY